MLHFSREGAALETVPKPPYFLQGIHHSLLSCLGHAQFSFSLTKVRTHCSLLQGSELCEEQEALSSWLKQGKNEQDPVIRALNSCASTSKVSPSEERKPHLTLHSAGAGPQEWVEGQDQ